MEGARDDCFLGVDALIRKKIGSRGRRRRKKEGM